MTGRDFISTRARKYYGGIAVTVCAGLAIYALVRLAIPLTPVGHLLCIGLIVVGMFAWFPAIFLRLRCPACGAWALPLCQGVNPILGVPKHVKFCMSCGLELDKEMPEGREQTSGEVLRKAAPSEAPHS